MIIFNIPLFLFPKERTHINECKEASPAQKFPEMLNIREFGSSPKGNFLIGRGGG
jgi:hypothetical protein